MNDKRTVLHSFDCLLSSVCSFLSFLIIYRQKKKEAVELEKKINEAIMIFDASDWMELLVGYLRSFYDLDDDGMRTGDEKAEFVDMIQPRLCSYIKHDMFGKVKETITIKAPPECTDSENIPVQFNGITIRQLRAIEVMIKRRCVLEGW